MLLTATLIGIAMTPAWFAPPWLAVPWQVAGVLLGVPALVISWRYAPWWPTPSAELPRILECLALEPRHAFCDLGAGDGRMVLWAHRASGATCTGIELAPLPWLVGTLRLSFAGPCARMIRGDVFRTDLSSYDVLYVWGTDYFSATPRFGRYVRDTLKPGARLVSYQHPIPGLQPARTASGGQRPIYVYEFPQP